MKSLRPLPCGFILRDTLLLRPPLCDNGTNWERPARFPPPQVRQQHKDKKTKTFKQGTHRQTNTKAFKHCEKYKLQNAVTIGLIGKDQAGSHLP